MTRGSVAQQRVVDAGIAREHRQMDELVVRHGFVGVHDERERFAGIFHGGAQMQFSIASSLTIWFAK